MGGRALSKNPPETTDQCRWKEPKSRLGDPHADAEAQKLAIKRAAATKTQHRRQGGQPEGAAHRIDRSETHCLRHPHRARSTLSLAQVIKVTTAWQGHRPKKLFAAEKLSTKQNKPR